jgi:haloalkane dehalogenase
MARPFRGMANLQAPGRPAWVDDRLFPFRSRFAAIDGHSYHYVDEGAGPVLLFVSPAPCWAFTFRHYVLALRDRFRCIVVDLPGFGLSHAAPGSSARLPEVSRSLGRFVEHLDLRGVTAWLNDTAGPVGMGVAVRDPGRFRAFVVGGTFGWSPVHEPMLSRMIGVFTSAPVRLLNRTVNLLPRMMGSVALGTRTLTKPERRQYSAACPDRARRDNLMALIRSFREEDAFTLATEAGLPTLRDRPVLLVFGEKDRAARLGWVAKWQGFFPRHRSRLVPGAMHFPFEDAPGAILPEFEAFWKEFGAGIAGVNGEAASRPRAVARAPSASI